MDRLGQGFYTAGMVATAPTRSIAKKLLWPVVCVLPLAVLVGLALMLPSCGAPNFASEADVLAVLQQPRSDEEWEALGDEGRRQFLRNNCQQCHVVEGIPRAAPRLANLYTTQAILRDGTKVDRDRAYVIRSILRPMDQVVVGYPQQMSSYRHLPAEDVAALLAYLERYSPPGSPKPGSSKGEPDSRSTGLPNTQE